jgi:hypothetical protein
MGALKINFLPAYIPNSAKFPAIRSANQLVNQLQLVKSTFGFCFSSYHIIALSSSVHSRIGIGYLASFFMNNQPRRHQGTKII